MDMTPTTARPIGDAQALVVMARPSQIALIGLVFAAGVLLGGSRPGPSAADPIDLTVAALLLLAASVVVHWANEAADAETDARSVRTPFSGGSGALARSTLTPEVSLRLSLGLAAGVGAATVVALTAGRLEPVAAPLLLVGLGGGLAYSLPPVAAMRHGWGELLNALLGGLALPLYGVAAMRGRIEPLDILAFLPFTAIVWCSVLATAWPDREADAATGKRTLQVRWPVSRLRRLHGAIALGWLAATGLTVLTDALPFAAAGLLVAPLLVLAHTWYTTDRSPWPSVAAMVGQIAIVTVGLAVTVA